MFLKRQREVKYRRLCSNSQKGRPEGVFSGGSNEEPLFYEALELDMPDIEAVQEKTHHRILRWLAHHGYLDPGVVEMMRAWSLSIGSSPTLTQGQGLL
jgi:hypothetical protein